MSVKGGLLCFAAITGAKVALNLQSRHDTEETKLVKSNTSSTQSASRTSSKHKQTSPQLMPLPSSPTSPTPSLTTISSSSDSSSRNMSPTLSSFSSSVSSMDGTETFARPQASKSRWLPLTADHYPPPFTPQPTKTLRNPSIESLRDGLHVCSHVFCVSSICWQTQDDFKSKGLDPFKVQTDVKTFDGVHRCMKHPSAMLVLMTTEPLTEELEDIRKAAKHVCLPCLVQSYMASASISESTTVKSSYDEGSVIHSKDSEESLTDQVLSPPCEKISGGKLSLGCASFTVEKHPGHEKPNQCTDKDMVSSLNPGHTSIGSFNPNVAPKPMMIPGLDFHNVSITREANEDPVVKMNTALGDSMCGVHTVDVQLGGRESATTTSKKSDTKHEVQLSTDASIPGDHIDHEGAIVEAKSSVDGKHVLEESVGPAKIVDPFSDVEEATLKIEQVTVEKESSRSASDAELAATVNSESEPDLPTTPTELSPADTSEEKLTGSEYPTQAAQLQKEDMHDESEGISAAAILVGESQQQTSLPLTKDGKVSRDGIISFGDEDMEKEDSKISHNSSVKQTECFTLEHASDSNTAFDQAAFHTDAQDIANRNTEVAAEVNSYVENSTHANKKSKKQNSSLSSFEELNHLQQDSEAMNRVRKQQTEAQAAGLFVPMQDQEGSLAHVFPFANQNSEKDIEYYPAYEPNVSAERKNDDDKADGEQHDSMASTTLGALNLVQDSESLSDNASALIGDTHEFDPYKENAAMVTESTKAIIDTASLSGNTIQTFISDQRCESITKEEPQECLQDVLKAPGDSRQAQVSLSEQCGRDAHSLLDHQCAIREDVDSSLAGQNEVDTPMPDVDGITPQSSDDLSENSDRPDVEVVHPQHQQELAPLPPCTIPTNPTLPGSHDAEAHRREIKALLFSFVDYREREKLQVISENLLAKGIPSATVMAGLRKRQAEKRDIFTCIPKTPSSSTSHSRPSLVLDLTKTPEFDFSSGSEVSFGSGNSSPVGAGSPSKTTYKKPTVSADSENEDDEEGRAMAPASRVKKTYKVGALEEETDAPLIEGLEKMKARYDASAELEPKVEASGKEEEEEDRHTTEAEPEEAGAELQKLEDGNASEGCENAPVAGKAELEEPESGGVESGGVESESARKEARKKSKKERRRAGKGKKN